MKLYAHIGGVIACTATLLGLAVAGAGHLAMSWFAIPPLAAIALGLLVVAALILILLRVFW